MAEDDAEVVLPQGFICLRLLEKHDGEKCITTAAQIEAMKTKFPNSAEFMGPTPDLAADCVSPEWLAFPEYPFEIGLTFPFPHLISRFFEATGLAFTQVMPVVWRNLVTVERLRAELDTKVGLEELAWCYSLRSHGPHRYGFRAKNKVYSLVTDSVDQDREWKKKFFYVRKSSLSGAKNFFSIWKENVSRLEDLFPMKEDNFRNVQAVCLEPDEKKKFIQIGSTSRAESAKEEVAQTMSSATQSDNPFDTSNLLSRFKRPKVEAVKQGEGSSKPKLAIGDQILFKKRKVEGVNVEDSDSIVAGIKTEIQDGVSMLINEIRLWKEKDAENGKALKEKDLEILGKDRRIKVLEVENKDLKAGRADAERKKAEELLVQKEHFIKEAGRAIFGARIQMIEEYLSGKAGEWNLEEEKATRREIDGTAAEVGEVSSRLQDAGQDAAPADVGK